MRRSHNKSFSFATIPDIWKTSTIVPLAKPGKDPKQAASYRPISLLSPVAKLMERLLLPSLNQHLPPADHQHGFRSGHSTTSALLQITNAISTGFNDKQPPRRTMVVALDLSKAFDSVDHDILRKILVDSTLPGWQVRWLSNYLRGRIARATFRNETSKARLCRTGVPQGSVISPVLFNAYLRDMPLPNRPMQMISYADDISIVTSSVALEEMEHQLTSYLKILGSFLADRKLIISATKSSVTLFTPDPAQYSYKPTVIVNDVVLPLEQHPKILGLTFDPKFTFANHATNVTKKVQQKNQVLKALAGRNWGQNKETILMTYKATSRAVMNYDTPAWTPTLSQTNFKKLQCKQNDALRTATGCLRLAPIKHLHQETLILPVQLHCRLLTDQYYSSCRRYDHPCRHLYGCPGPPRNKKLTLEMYSKVRVKRATTSLENRAKPCTVRAVQRKLHEKAVHRTRKWIGNNSLINKPPPKISADEVSLPRATRAHLAQFRSGYSHLLATTRSRFDDTGLTSSRCPYCQNDDEDVPHVFACRKRHVSCNLLDLWNRPSTVAAEIGL